MERKPLDTGAASVMVLLCMLWGFANVASKLAAPDVSLVMQAGLRSAIACVLLLLWTRMRGVPLFLADGTLGPGLVAGALFAGEFLFVYAGLARTAASRMVVFLYLAPCFTALGLHLFVPGERLRRVQWLGLAAAFGGVVLAFGEGFRSSPATLAGDAFGLVGALLWAATTVFIRATSLSRISASKVLFYQLATSATALPLASVLIGEPGVVALTPLALASLAYQGAMVAFASYLAWFWLLTRYLAGRLSVFSFLTPLFGVLAGALVLAEPLRAPFLLALALVGAGIYLVNRPAR